MWQSWSHNHNISPDLYQAWYTALTKPSHSCAFPLNNKWVLTMHKINVPDNDSLFPDGRWFAIYPTYLLQWYFLLDIAFIQVLFFLPPTWFTKIQIRNHLVSDFERLSSISSFIWIVLDNKVCAVGNASTEFSWLKQTSFKDFQGHILFLYSWFLSLALFQM